MTATIPETAAGEVGRARLRKEDARLLTGRTRWTDNVTLPGMLHLAILRSPHAHAQISRIDVSGALAAPNVIAAFTGADVAERQGSLPCAWPVTEDMVHPNHPALAVDEVRHVGEAVAVVVAQDRASAVDALEGVEVEYEPLPVVLDMEEALADGAAQHRGRPGRGGVDDVVGHPDPAHPATDAGAGHRRTGAQDPGDRARRRWRV